MNTEINKFIMYSKLHAEHNSARNYKKANAAHDNLIANIREIRSKDKKLAVLVPLLNHENEAVRTWAATYLLPTNEDEAKAVLRATSLGDTMVAFDSEMVLSLWEKGELKFAA